MSAIYPDLKNKTVLVSGGAGGIGAAIVEAFCLQGANVAFVDISKENSQQTATNIGQKCDNAPYYQVADLRDVNATTAAVEQLMAQCGEFSVLINNAGHDETHQFGKVDSDYFDDRVGVNLKHQYFLAQQLANHMIKAKQGRIINLGSISWMMGAENVSVYTMLKSAVMGLTKSLARELGHHNITVNSIAPGWVLTERQLEKANRFPEKLDAYLQRQCIKEHLQPNDIARLCLWLASAESRRLTGQTIIYDGGVI